MDRTLPGFLSVFPSRRRRNVVNPTSVMRFASLKYQIPNCTRHLHTVDYSFSKTPFQQSDSFFHFTTPLYTFSPRGMGLNLARLPFLTLMRGRSPTKRHGSSQG